MEKDKYCKNCTHYLPAECLGTVCMNVRSDCFGKRVMSMDGCQLHSPKEKKKPVKKMS